MRPRRLAKRLLRAVRGGITATAAVAFLAAAIGVPLPSGARKDRSVAFPCMYRSCGCHDAAGCKDHCCCFSNEEKLAWAAEHQVDPTPFAHASLPSEDGLPRPSCDNCDAIALVSCATRCDLTASASHQPAESSGASCCETKSNPSSSPAKTVWLSIAAYRHCTGLAPLWTLVGAALPPPLPSCYEFEWAPSGDVAMMECHLEVVALEPSPPPPRS